MTDSGDEVSPQENQFLETTAEWLAELGDATVWGALSDGPLNDLPVFGTIVKLWRIHQSLRDVVFEKKLRAFLLATTSIDREERKRFRERLEGDPELRSKTGEHLVTMLDRFDDAAKAPLLAHAFAALLDGRIDLDEFRRASHVLDRTVVADLVALRDHMRGGRTLKRAEFDGLEAVGLVAVQHSIIRRIEADEHEGQIEMGGTSIRFRVTRPASTLVKSVFPES